MTQRRPPPKTLFKYYGMDETTFNVLANKEIWCSARSLFDDPFDCDIELSAEISDQDYLQLVEKILKQGGRGFSDPIGPLEYRSTFLENIKTQYTKQKNETGVFCLAESPRDKVMWSHYADGHRGICLEIELDQDLFQSEDIVFVDVTYEDHPNLSYWDMAESVFEGKSESIGFVARLMSHKGLEWKYQSEWRFFAGIEPGSNGRLVELPGKIETVFFGLKMEETSKDRIHSILGSSVGYKQATRIPGTFELSFDP